MNDIELDQALRDLPAPAPPQQHADAVRASALERLRTRRPASQWERLEPFLLSALAAIQLAWTCARILAR